MNERYYNPMEDYENQMRKENGAVSQYNNNYGHFLNDILARVFGGNVAQASPTPTPPVRERNPKGFARPYVMSLQEYQDNYLPYYGLNYQDIPQQELPQQFNRMSNPDRDYYGY